MGEESIDHESPVDVHGKKCAGVSAASSKGIDQRTFSEDNRVTSAELSSGDG
jgi:hypothetical protein